MSGSFNKGEDGLLHLALGGQKAKQTNGDFYGHLTSATPGDSGDQMKVGPHWYVTVAVLVIGMRVYEKLLSTRVSLMPLISDQVCGQQSGKEVAAATPLFRSKSFWPTFPQRHHEPPVLSSTSRQFLSDMGREEVCHGPTSQLQLNSMRLMSHHDLLYRGSIKFTCPGTDPIQQASLCLAAGFTWGLISNRPASIQNLYYPGYGLGKAQIFHQCATQRAKKAQNFSGNFQHEKCPSRERHLLCSAVFCSTSGKAGQSAKKAPDHPAEKSTHKF